METYELDQYAAQIASATGGVQLLVERMSTAALVDRVVQEGADGKWDVIFGLALTALRAPRMRPWLAPCEISATDTLPPGARDPDGTWFCPSAFVPAFCLNDDRLKARGIRPPTSWADLADSRFSGELVLADPNYSGAGFLHLTALLQSAPEDLIWALLRRVASNRPRIERSAFAPCVVVAADEASVGVTVTTAAGRANEFAQPLRFVVPEDAAGVEPEAFAVRCTSPQRDEAVRVLAWTLTPAAASLYAAYHKVGLVSFAASHRADFSTSMFMIDIDQAITSRESAVRQWTRTFCSPS